MKDNIIGIISGVILIIMAWAIVFVAESSQSYYQNKAIECGCGKFNETTGQFEWVNKKE